MAGTFELFDSRKATIGGDNPQHLLRWRVYDVDDDASAASLVLASLPAEWNGFPLNSYDITPEGNGLWIAEARYGKREPREVGRIKLSFDSSGGKEKVTQSLESTYYVADGDDEIDFQGAINVKKSGDKLRVEGVEVIVPKIAITLERIMSNPPLGDWIDALFLKTGTVNSDTINLVIPHGSSFITLNVAPGEFLFMGATGQEDGIEKFPVTMKFEFSPNQTDLAFDEITGITKRGWDYLWISYEDDDSDGENIVQAPRQVCVEQVYPMVSHAELFI